MALLVQKFGGTSIGNIERIKIVAEKIQASVAAGNQVVVVVSAMNGVTSGLHATAHKISTQPDSFELDALLATGEQASAALLAMALKERGAKAQSFGAAQLSIIGDNRANHARICSMQLQPLQNALACGAIPVVTGFQAIGSNRQWLTLGRGGSDTTAVALAAALKADECQIYTDVDGIYTADPRIVNNAYLLQSVSITELGAMSSSGAKVMQRRAIECAARHNVKLRILSSFTDSTGTLVQNMGADKMEQATLTGVSFEQDQVLVNVHVSNENPAIALHQLLQKLASCGVHIDFLKQTFEKEHASCSFILRKDDYHNFEEVITYCQQAYENVEFTARTKFAKLALVGVGIGSRPQVAADILATLRANDLNISQIVAEDHRYTILLSVKDVEKAARFIHKEFLEKQVVT